MDAAPLPRDRARFTMHDGSVGGRAEEIWRSSRRFAVSTVGVVGLGLLGHAIASRLIAATHRVVGHDIVGARADALKQLGGETAASASAVAKSVDVVCTVLPSLDAVESVVLGDDGIVAAACPGTTIAQMSTISPALTERLAREVTARGLGFLDCPISGTSAMVERGQGVIFVGGERALFDRWEPMLAVVLPRPVYIGRAGQAMTLKLVANLLVALHSAAAAEALVMARQAGLDLGLVLDVLGAGAATSRMLEVRGPLIARGTFPAQMKLDLFMKDLHLIQDAARAVGAPLPLTDVAERLYASVDAAGHGGEDLAVVVRALEHMTGAKP
jgi:3-hydroxyisobutyrate dehydrogenase-like beta-hydroxyacid dehydrogenase